MIKKSNNTSKFNFKKEIEQFIPTSWKLIDLVFLTIAEGHYNELQDGVIPVDDDGVVLDRKLVDVDFNEAAVTLFIESCQRCSRDLPYELYNIDTPALVLDALRLLAKDILDNYILARPHIENNEVLELFDVIRDNCQIILDLIDYKQDIDEYGGYIWNGLQYFSHLDMKPWFRIVNGTCIENVDYDLFSHVLDCAGAYDIAYEDGRIVTEDYTDGTLTPQINYGMAMYAFIILLMTKRVASNIDKSWTLDAEGNEVFDKAYWAKEFSKRLNWKSEWYYVNEDSWKEAYLSEGSILAPEGVSDEERMVLEKLLGRSSFNDLLSPSHLDSILHNHTDSISFNQYRYLHSASKEELECVLSVIRKELAYLYDNIDCLSDHFMDKDSAEDEQLSLRLAYEEKKKNNKFIVTQFSSIPAVSVKAVQRLLFNNHLYFDVYSWNQPIIYSEIVYEFIKNCIIQEEKLKTFILQSAKDNDDNIGTFKKVGPVAGIKSSFIEDMSEYLNEDNEIICKKAVFVRALVRKGYVPANDDWNKIFSVSRWKELLAPDSSKKIESDELLELTGKLRWDKYDRVFKFKGILQSKKQLQQAFSDGDYTCKQRVEALKALYQRIME